jgi:hypothetical protein
MPTIVASGSHVIVNDDELEAEIRRESDVAFRIEGVGDVGVVRKTKTSGHGGAGGSVTTWPIEVRDPRSGRTIRGKFVGHLEAVEDGWALMWQVIVDIDPRSLPERTE